MIHLIARMKEFHPYGCIFYPDSGFAAGNVVCRGRSFRVRVGVLPNNRQGRSLILNSNLFFRLMVPLIVNPLTPNNTRQEWALAFYVLGGIMVLCNIFYCFFASAELQPWATPQVKKLKKKLKKIF